MLATLTLAKLEFARKASTLSVVPAIYRTRLNKSYSFVQARAWPQRGLANSSFARVRALRANPVKLGLYKTDDFEEARRVPRLKLNQNPLNDV